MMKEVMRRDLKEEAHPMLQNAIRTHMSALGIPSSDIWVLNLDNEQENYERDHGL